MHVQAARDGRLAGAAAVEPLSHLASCPLCQAEQLADREIRTRIEGVVHDTNDVALRRLRQRVLAESNRALLAHGEGASRWRRPVLALGLLASVAAAALWFVPSAPRAEPVVVTAVRDARWTRTVTRDVEHVDLSSGTLLFRVARRSTDPRLVVRVPDGEIEDLGTTFSVSVSEGRTQEIAVQEGRVMFRRRGSEDLQLLAGSTWRASEEAKRAASVEPVHAEPAPAPVVPAVEAGDEAAMVKAKPPSHRAHLHVVRDAATEAQPAPVASSDDEDAAYLRILALLHEQRGEEARLAAFAYLRAFPNGLKAREVRDVAEQYGKGHSEPRHD